MAGSTSAPTLQRTLGLFSTTMLMVGIVIGTGVFKKIVPMAQTGIDDWVIILAWILAGTISLFGAYTVGGLASLTDKPGGVFEYFRLSYGKKLTFYVGWVFFLVLLPAANAAFCFLLADSFHYFFPLPRLSSNWESIEILGLFPFRNIGVKLFGLSALTLFTFANIKGTKESGLLNNILTTVKVIGLLAVIAVGLTYQGGTITPLSDATNEGSPGNYIVFLSGLLTAMMSAFWAYDGWYVVPSMAGEIKNPQKTLPVALTIGMFIIVGIYVTINLSYLIVMSPYELAKVGETEIGAAVVMSKVLGEFGNVFVMAVIFFCVLGTLNGNILAAPRHTLRMAQEGWLPSRFGKLHPRFRTPVNALIINLILSSVLLFSGSFEILTDLIIFLIFIVFGLLGWALIKHKRSGVVTAKVTGYPYIQWIYIGFAVVFTINSVIVGPRQAFFGLLVILTGWPVYRYFKKRK